MHFHLMIGMHQKCEFLLKTFITIKSRAENIFDKKPTDCRLYDSAHERKDIGFVSLYSTIHIC